MKATDPDDEIEVIEILVSDKDVQEFKRLDAFLAAKLPEFSRSLVKKFFQDGKISFSDESIKTELKKMPPIGTEILFEVPPAKAVDIEPQNIPLEILFEDEHLILINKPAGLVVHPAPGNPDQTLVNAILYHCPDLKGIGNEKRPGIVHRLDKGTSGVMVVAKNQKCHEGLVNLFSKHDIERRYQAIVLGSKIPPSHTLESTIGRSPHNRLKMAANVKNGKNAITHMKVIQFFDKFSHVELKLETGRTHQIRVHLSQLLNTPIVNDLLYGRSKEEIHFQNSVMRNILKDYDYPLLHAKELGFNHPVTGEYLNYQTPPPPAFQAVLAALNGDELK